ncbi:MAG: precorrin-6A synthase (deacetylating) [Proteobacteria bacterium]|nr:precorrin-6A synthase (deacetylating) [Pseudomonadota bacterium]MBU6424961.1 precorrin-6A synthase (deacetylating) [Rhodospirillales bacterium]
MTTRISLIGIGVGNPEHLTLEAVRVINEASLILIPRKSVEKGDLADLRRQICADVLKNPATRLVEFDLPVREAAAPDYGAGVEAWHDDIAARWRQVLQAELPEGGEAALLVWGDPSLFDSTLRIAARLDVTVRVVPGITAIQGLTAAHAMVLNEIGQPFLVTTGRQLRAQGWPEGVDTLVVMLDAGCAFEVLDPEGVTIWWGAYLGMERQMIRAGTLADTGAEIRKIRAAARAEYGWIMDVYILRRQG